jgi:hypothetical protein
MDGTPNLAQASESDAPQNVAERLTKQVAVPLFEAALLRLGRAWTHGEVMVLFNGRVSYTAIQDWRSGRRRVPQWAWDYLALLIEQNMADDASVHARVRNPPIVAPGQGSHRNIAKWNARRAKEKAAPKDGPPSSDLISD